jgi:hypothetical protein
MASSIAAINDNICNTYHLLDAKVQRALRTQVGEEQRLMAQRARVLNFMAVANQVCP